MDSTKKEKIEILVDTAINSFSYVLSDQKSNNNNCFIDELGEEFMFYYTFAKIFENNFGNVLETLGNNIAKLSYTVKKDIDSFILPEQQEKISSIIDSYSNHTSTPDISHYNNVTTIYPNNISNYARTHITNHYLYSEAKNEHYLILLTNSGILDDKTARTEKSSLLNEYFLLKNLLKNNSTTKVKIFFATTYNKNGEGNTWNQEHVRQYFAEDELLIGKDYWNFVCDDENGYNIILSQYIKSIKNIFKINYT